MLLSAVVCALAIGLSRDVGAAPVAVACMTKRWTEHFVIDPTLPITKGHEPSVETDRENEAPLRRQCWLTAVSARSMTIGCVTTFPTQPKAVQIADVYTIDRTTGQARFKSSAALEESIRCLPDRKMF